MAPTLNHGVSRDVATHQYERYTMSDRLLNGISNTVDRRKPHAAFADGGSVPNWIVLPH